MEFDFRHLKTSSRPVLVVSLLGLLAPAGLGIAVGPWLHRTFASETPFFGFQFFVCIALAAFLLVVQKVLGPALVWVWRRSGNPADGQPMSSGFLAVLLIALMLCCLATIMALLTTAMTAPLLKWWLPKPVAGH